MYNGILTVVLICISLMANGSHIAEAWRILSITLLACEMKAMKAIGLIWKTCQWLLLFSSYTSYTLESEIADHWWKSQHDLLEKNATSLHNYL